jgi:hypothetical protein
MEFHSAADGRKRELAVTSLSKESVAGYLLAPKVISGVSIRPQAIKAASRSGGSSLSHSGVCRSENLMDQIAQFHERIVFHRLLEKAGSPQASHGRPIVGRI